MIDVNCTRLYHELSFLFRLTCISAFCKADAVEHVHTQFCKSLLGVKTSTQNDFIYGELGRIDLKTIRIYSAVKFWLKILGANENKYINVVYKFNITSK